MTFIFIWDVFFGSRIVQNDTKDRIYDDNSKVWYLYLDENRKVLAFLSVCEDVIKNIYSTNNAALKELLLDVKKKISIKPSIVTNIYENIYLDCGLKINKLDNYKHFIMIRGEE